MGGGGPLIPGGTGGPETDKEGYSEGFDYMLSSKLTVYHYSVQLYGGHLNCGE